MELHGYPISIPNKEGEIDFGRVPCRWWSMLTIGDLSHLRVSTFYLYLHCLIALLYWC